MREWNIGGMMIGREKPRYSERNLPQCHFVHQKSRMDCLGIKLRPPW
jgi:hypothetical protein